MDKEITETKTVTKKIVVDHKLYCDVCKKEIPDNSWYYTLITGHHEWGSDSIESVDNIDLCSESCVQNRLDFYFKELIGKGYNTAYFDLDRDYYRKENYIGK